MDTERALISKIISTGQLEDAISKGVRADLFADDECREMFEYVTDHARRYKSPPSLSAVQADKPEFDLQLVQDPLDYVVDKFNVLAKRRLANDMVIELAKLCDDPKAGPDIDMHFMEASRKLATLVPTTEVHKFVGDMDKRIKNYEERVKSGNKFGLTWGFPKLDEWTGGIRPTDFCTVSGFSGLGKSTFLKAVAFNIWLAKKTPLYISLEEEASVRSRRAGTRWLERSTTASSSSSICLTTR
jgi:replicative DNA helicase